MTNHINIKKLTPEKHLNQYNELLRYAFQVTQKQLLDYGWEDDDIRQSKLPVLEKARVRGCFCRDKLASQFAVYPMKMNIFNQICKIGFITSVATYPEYTGMGLMSKLMRKALEEMREQGENLAILYPFSIPLYRHRGWEIIADKMTFRIKDSQLPQNISSSGYVLRVDKDNREFKLLHNTFAAQTHGCLMRNDLAWEEYWRWAEDDTNVAVYYDNTSTPQGYIVYLIRDNIMFMKEMIYLTHDARKGLWRYISAHESMINEVQGNNYSSEPIAFLLEDSDIKETIRPYIMGRIVDVINFLNEYRFAIIEKPTSLTIKVTDHFLEWNNHTFLIDISADGRAKASLCDLKPDFELGIGTLTSMLMGYKSAQYLAKIERLSVNTGKLEILNRIIRKEKAYISDYI